MSIRPVGRVYLPVKLILGCPHLSHPHFLPPPGSVIPNQIPGSLSPGILPWNDIVSNKIKSTCYVYVVYFWFSVATLLFVTGEEAIKHLFSRNTQLELNFASLAVGLVYYFIMACWAAGTSISSGLVVPML